MDIYIFSDNKNAGKYFAGIKKGFTISFYPFADFKKRLAAGGGGFIYLDAWNQTEAAMKKTMQTVNKIEGFNFGVIDAKGIFKDTALVFFEGASDYIGKELATSGLNAKRLQQALDFRSEEIACFLEKEKIKGGDYILSGDSWQGIKSGNEYTFLFMFIELDNKAEFKKMGHDYASVVLKKFHDHISDVVSSVNGKVWMWMDFGGLVLFPFDGKECSAIIPAFKLMLDNTITSSEIFNLDILLTYRIAMHVGNTVYRTRGDTGTIVSDSINSIFHLGQKFTAQGNFCITKEVFQYIPKGLGHCFTLAGDFEGREILKMIPLK
ncbi:MAG TPA: hypothetical protein PK926_13960 [Spirochaetota bacterium]|nr:hypothetical protein [Spirochaetota bacterium]HPI88680.1 hypothetical protein [Spirochaetota bacterium]HPR49121.1 hypothetical protein [Spirochaetota bacterium]